MFLCSPGWPEIHVAVNIWSSCGARSGTESFMHARQAHGQSWAPSLAFGPLCMSCLTAAPESARSQRLTQEAEVHPLLRWPQWLETQAEMSQFPLSPLFPPCFLPTPSLHPPPPRPSITELIPRVTNPGQQSEERRAAELQRRDECHCGVLVKVHSVVFPGIRARSTYIFATLSVNSLEN